MIGKCPGCNRSYDISDDFLNMGGKAKCPHCLEELAFQGQPEATRLDPREDQTRIDPNRLRATTRVDPDEVDARCPACERRFKIDSQYLRMGGQAKCPHCGQDLAFDVPQQAPPPKPPAEEDLWDDTTGQTVEVGSQRAAGEEEAWDDELGSDGDEADQDGQGLDDEPEDPYSGTGEVSLPELEGLQPDDWEEGDLPDYDQDDEGDEFDRDELPTEVMTSPFAAGQEEQDDMQTPDEVGLEEDRSADGSASLAAALDEELADGDEALGAEESLDGLAGALGDALAAEADPAPPQASVEGLDEDEEPYDDSTKEVSGDWAEQLDARAAAMEAAQDAPAPPVGADPTQEDAGGEPDAQAAPFENLASTDDWAAAAAAWAESGFSTDQMPAFIKSEPPPDDEASEAGPLRAEDLPKVGQDGPAYRTTPSGQNLEALRASSLPADAPADSVEVSDADIIMLDEAEVEVLSSDESPSAASVPEESWARRASREVSARPAEARAPAAPRRAPAFLSRLASPPVLAAVLGVLALVIISLMWVLLGSGEDVEGVAFPTQGLKAERIKAPAPKDYKAKESAIKHYGLGNRAAHLGHFEQAILEYQKASRLDPGYPNPHRAMGSIYAALGKRQLSLAAYQLYLQLSPDSPDAAQVRTILGR